MVASLLRSSSDRPGDEVNFATSTILTANSYNKRRDEAGNLTIFSSNLIRVTVNASPDHAERTLPDDLMDLVNVIEEDLLLV